MALLSQDTGNRFWANPDKDSKKILLRKYELRYRKLPVEKLGYSYPSSTSRRIWVELSKYDRCQIRIKIPENHQWANWRKLQEWCQWKHLDEASERLPVGIV